jgi:hypothetical protein
VPSAGWASLNYFKSLRSNVKLFACCNQVPEDYNECPFRSTVAGRLGTTPVWGWPIPLEGRRTGAHTDGVLLAIVLLVMLSLPFLVRLVSWFVRGQWEQIEARRSTGRTSGHSIERVADDLRRLRRQWELRENRPGNVGKGMKMGAVRRAYVEVLGTACRQLDVRPPQQIGELQTPLAEIYRVESELRARGLDVRTDGWDQHAA